MARLRTIVAAFSVVLALTSAIAMSTDAPTSRAATARKGNFDVIRKRGDGFRNYDFTEKSVSRKKVDWAVDLLFWNDAEINKVKDALASVDGKDVYDAEGSQLQARLKNNGGAYEWDEDKGKKTTKCPGAPFQPDSAFHYRIYATPGNDRMFNRTWGYYTFATTHIDYKECTRKSAKFGWSERAENFMADTASDEWGAAAVLEDHRSFENHEPFRKEKNHIWDNDGKATYIRVP